MSVVSLSVPHFKQELPYSCMAACVRMVLAHYRRDASEDEYRQLLGTSPYSAPPRATFCVLWLSASTFSCDSPIWES